MHLEQPQLLVVLGLVLNNPHQQQRHRVTAVFAWALLSNFFDNTTPYFALSSSLSEGTLHAGMQQRQQIILLCSSVRTLTLVGLAQQCRQTALAALQHRPTAVQDIVQ